MKSAAPAGTALSFEATLENWAEGMDYCAVPVPASITEALGTRGSILVSARLNDSAPFKVSLFPVGGGRHYIRIKANVRKATGTKTGDRVRLRITVLDRASVRYPDDLLAALRAQKAMRDFDALTPGRRNYISPHRRGRETGDAPEADSGCRYRGAAAQSGAYRTSEVIRATAAVHRIAVEGRRARNEFV